MSEYIAYDKNSMAVEAIGNAEEIIVTLSTNYSLQQIREDIVVYEIKQKVVFNVLLENDHEPV